MPPTRPHLLYPLFAEARSLKGIGPRLAPVLEKLTGPKVRDVLFHLPTGVTDRRITEVPLAGIAPGTVITVDLIVVEHQPARSARAPYRIYAEHASGAVVLTFFHARADFLTRALPPGERRIVSGKLDLWQGLPQIVHPDRILTPEEAETGALPDFEPVYPLTAKLTGRTLAKIVAAAVDAAPDLPEWLDPAWQARMQWPRWQDAIRAVHRPDDPAVIDPLSPPRQRLAFDELLASQLAMALRRRWAKTRSGRSVGGDGHLRRAVIETLPYGLTGDQKAALRDVEADMACADRMLRLIQGDVGAGKTIVAFLSLLLAVETGSQAALMAPTEILARQHLESLKPMAERIGVRLDLLTGRDKKARRTAVLGDLASGEIDILIGTHALFQDDVAFADLALVVIDEQHRFGVHQRLALSAKGTVEPDILVMTATPIPRTLALTHYGDLDVSVIREKPPGRQPVKTIAKPLTGLADVVDGIARQIAGGARVYWVCPLVEQSDTVDLSAVEERFAALEARFPGAVGLVHGRMGTEQKDAVMTAFTRGDIAVLVATTVIEVGVNVPEATIMVIEHAERFGLAQLHQLRGRVGRGTAASTCILLYATPLGETAEARMRVMRETEDGFRIAEEDLRLRGEGEILGTRQSGVADFRLADLQVHQPLHRAAYDDARLIAEQDPELETARGQALRMLLHLFEKESTMRLLTSG